MAYVSFGSFLGLLFGIQSWLYAEGQVGTVEKHALIGEQVNLTCYLNSTAGVVTWGYRFEANYLRDIYTCLDSHNSQCTRTVFTQRLALIYTDLNLQATRRNETSILSLIVTEEELYFWCSTRDYILQEYVVTMVNSSRITPNCSVTPPTSDENGNSMTLSCEVNSGELDVNLTLEGIGLNVPDNSAESSQSTKVKTFYFDDFDNVHNASCKAYFPDIDKTRTCIYPNIIKAQHIVEGNDIIVECDDESDVDQWRFYTSDGGEEDIEDRSWIREGGRSLLIRDVSERDVGKVVVCRIKGDDNQTNKGTIGFHVISKTSGDTNTPNSGGSTITPSAPNPYLVPMLLFLTLWLITIAVGGVWLGGTPKRNKSGSIAIASASGNASVPNGDSGERGASLFNVGTGARGDQNTLNTNNSAHNPAFEPEVSIADENNRNRQSNNESHLYFTLEKSSPSPMNSLPRALTEKWKQPYANPESLNQLQSSHWQGYEPVGEPNKGATCSYDIGEYAEVGGLFQGKGPPDLGEYTEVGGLFQGKRPPDLSGRPSIRKKPERKKVKENDISSIYSKVNK